MILSSYPEESRRQERGTGRGGAPHEGPVAIGRDAGDVDAVPFREVSLVRLEKQGRLVRGVAENGNRAEVFVECRPERDAGLGRVQRRAVVVLVAHGARAEQPVRRVASDSGRSDNGLEPCVV